MKRTVFRETYSTRGYDFRVLKLLIGLVAFFLLGCNAVSKKGATSDSTASQEHRTVVVPALVRTEGKVVRTNLKLNFVVLDFGFKRLPQVGQQLGIFRLGKKLVKYVYPVRLGRPIRLRILSMVMKFGLVTKLD